MQANPQTAAKLRSIIRWTTGTATTAAILVAACSLFPILSSFSAFSMTFCFALYIGLQIALPPVDEEDEWVPVRQKNTECVESSEVENDESTVAIFPVHIREAI